MPVTELRTFQDEMKNFERWRNMIRPESEERLEAFIEERDKTYIQALSSRLEGELLKYYGGDDGRYEEIRETLDAMPFNVGAAAFSVSTGDVAARRIPETRGKGITDWVAALQERLLEQYLNAPKDQRLLRLAEISFMFRAFNFKFQFVSPEYPLKVAAKSVSADTIITPSMSAEPEYGGDCPAGTKCIDGNCVAGGLI